MATLCPQRGFPSQHALQETNVKKCDKAGRRWGLRHSEVSFIFSKPNNLNVYRHHIQTDSRLRYSSMDRVYFFQDLRSDALKAMSWPSRCGAIVRPASGNPETVNRAEQNEERADTAERRVEKVTSEPGGSSTWWHHSVIEGGMVGTDGPHEAKHTATKHGRQKCVKCSVEQQDEA